jgi:hypothetical protein
LLLIEGERQEKKSEEEIKVIIYKIRVLARVPESCHVSLSL